MDFVNPFDSPPVDLGGSDAGTRRPSLLAQTRGEGAPSPSALPTPSPSRRDSTGVVLGASAVQPIFALASSAPSALPPSPSQGTPRRAPSARPLVASIPIFVNRTRQAPTMASLPARGVYIPAPLDLPRRRSVDVGVLGLGSHRHGGGAATSKRMRDAVGPDAGDKQVGVFGSGPKGGKDRLLGRHLASILAHSLALCADPVDIPEDLPLSTLPVIPASPAGSPSSSRNTSIASMPLSASSQNPSNAGVPELESPTIEIPLRLPAAHLSFPVLSETKRLKLISNLQSWTFNAMGYSSEELLGCVGLIFESVRNMEGVEFDLDRFKSLLISVRSAYHDRNGYHNFSHATDVTQALYSFLVRMGLAPPLFLLGEDDYDSNKGEARRKWRRNRAVADGGMGELLPPMDVFALMVAAIGHDVGHPGLSNAYMVNARTPVAQVYEDKSVLENFHTVTLMHMLRRHHFDYLLGGDFGHLGDQATSFRKVLEASILATDMSRHFAFVNEISDMSRRFGERRGSSPATPSTVEADRLLLCSGLMKCADISNPTRPHRISRAWSTALLNEWAGQAAIETEFNLPVTVMCLDASDTKAQAKSQVGFIDLFAKPLFNAMAGVVDEFADFAEKLRDGRTAWETISLQTDEAHQANIAGEWKLSAPPLGRSAMRSTVGARKDASQRTFAPHSAPASTVAFLPSPPISVTTARGRTHPSNLPVTFNRPNSANSPTLSQNESPISAGFSDSNPSTSFTTTSSTAHVSNGFTPTSSTFPLQSLALLMPSTFVPSSCGGTCHSFTAMCETCSNLPENRRGSLGRALAGIRRKEEEEEEEGDEDTYVPFDVDHPEWPPFPFRPSKG